MPNATMSQYLQLGKMIQDGALTREFVQSVLEGRVEVRAPCGHETITVPSDATAASLVSEAKAAFERAGIPFTYFDQDLLQLVRQDLELVRGKTCKVLVHNFGRDWETPEGLDVQKECGFDGNAAAYLVWVTKTKPMGWSVSIPNDDTRLHRGPGDDLYAPSFDRDDGRREFYLLDVWFRWFGRRSLVAFSAI